MRAGQFAKAQHAARAAGWTAFASMQNRYNLVNREEEREMIPLCLDQGIGILPYSPLARGLLARGLLARGLLAGTRERSGDRHTLRSSTDDLFRCRAEDFDVVDTVRAIALQRSLAPAQIALAWLLGKPGVSAPIIGATQLRHLDEAVPALDITLTEDETARLEARYRPHFDGEYT
jgi:aryl-alcohol dehydrogenase-like predicted oxidoreductase